MVENHRNGHTERCIVFPTVLKVEPLVHILKELLLLNLVVGNTECDLAPF